MVAVRVVLLLFLAFVSCLSSCQGRTLVDREDGPDDEEEWPVLCPQNTFFSRKEDKCQTCSLCPVNEIITSPCQGFYDTKCGPFYDFKSFLPLGAVPPKNQNDGDDQESDTQFKDLVKSESNPAPGSSKNLKDTMSSSDQNQASENNLNSSDPGWRSLTLTLIIIISLFVIVIAVIVGGICFIRRKIQNDKKLVCEYSPPPVQM